MTYEEYKKTIPVLVEIVSLLKNHLSKRTIYNDRFFTLPKSNFYIKQINDADVDIRISKNSDSIIRVAKESQSFDGDLPLLLRQFGDVYCSSRKHPGYIKIYSSESDIDLLDVDCPEEQLFQYSTILSNIDLIVLELELELQKVLDENVYCVITLFYDNDYYSECASYNDYVNLRDDLKDEKRTWEHY
ncbi:hypothetical protein [Klebsiella phage phiKp_21]|nr:hypothetical protein [Klebsiella phage phiKp_21]